MSSESLSTAALPPKRLVKSSMRNSGRSVGSAHGAKLRFDRTVGIILWRQRHASAPIRLEHFSGDWKRLWRIGLAGGDHSTIATAGVSMMGASSRLSDINL